MLRKCVWIIDKKEVCSKGGSGVPDISILATNAFDDQLASEEVVWTFFVAVRVRIGLLSLTMGSISGGNIRTRHWTGEEVAAAVVPAKDSREGNLECRLPTC